MEEVKELPWSARGAGGWGSTGDGPEIKKVGLSRDEALRREG